MTKETTQDDSVKSIVATSARAFGLSFKKEPLLTIFNIVLNIFLAALIYLQLTSFSNIVNDIVAVKGLGGVVTKSLIRHSIVLGISFLLPAILQNLYNRFSEDLRMRLMTHMMMLRVDSIAKLDIGTIESTDFQTKLERAEQWGIGSITNLVMISFNIIRSVSGFVVSAIILYLINPSLVLLALIGSLPVYFIQRKYSTEQYLLYHERTDDSRILGDRNSFFRDSKKIVELMLFSLINRFRADIKEANDAFDSKILGVGKRKSFATFWSDALNVICLLIAIALVTMQTIHGGLLVGALLLAFSTYRSFTAVTQDFYQAIPRLEDQARYSERWFELFDVKSKIVNNPNAIKPDWEIPPVIEFKNVSFSYPDTEVVVLKNISFIIKSGEKLAVVGLNGAGKTTLIKLLCRVYDPTIGEILVNGQNLKDIDLDYWREYLGVLFQDFSNYQMTARQAIAIARPNLPIDDEKVLWAAEMAGAAEFIEELPKKYDHLLWKGFHDGVALSKGQFQRMAVARIFYRDAFISVLDEPTSAIDTVAEEKIFEVLEKKMEGKTVVLISHRFSTVKNADKIAVIEHGELKEIGSHKDLMAKKGRYEELFSMQANRYLENEE